MFNNIWFYLVPLLRYLIPKNTVSLKSGSGVTQSLTACLWLSY